jgi:aspartokinase/homoserine dehydrogenase 1
MKRAIQVFKFGGTSVGSAEAVQIAAKLTAQAAPSVVTVVSAMSGVTDLLLGAAQDALHQKNSQASNAAQQFQQKHVELISALQLSAKTKEELFALVEEQTSELRAILQSVALLRELTRRTQDLIVARGERLLARIFCAYFQEHYCGQSIKSVQYIDATELIFTEQTLGSLWPNFAKSTQALQEHLLPLIQNDTPVVVPGYIGSGPDGEVITLGRGGSDFSAAIIARCVGAAQVTLYKEVDGLMTADPKNVPEAKVLHQLHYREAAELAYYGAKILHPRTMIPLLEPQIPLFIKNTFRAEAPGTKISGEQPASTFPVKALTAIQGQALLSIEGNGMMGVPGVAQKTFGALSTKGISVSMISQASSEASICFVLPEVDAKSAQEVLEKAFQEELAARLIDAVRVEPQIALVAVVGLGMRGTRGIAARTFGALSAKGINIIAMAQGSSELNITIAISQSDVTRALQALHQEYQLDRIRPLEDVSGKETALTIFGFGQIGRTLSKQINAQQSYFAQSLGIQVKQVAVIDRSGIKLSEAGLTEKELEQLAAQKESKQRFFLEPQNIKESLQRGLFLLPSYRSIFVDLTADETNEVLEEAIKRGFHLVLANKKPLAAPQEKFDALFSLAQSKGVSIRYEATVGAGLPILDTLHKLKEAGDPVHSVLGCLSGTLGYLMSKLEEGVSFSEAVKKAYELGYTEPDPRDDLCGMDVARKALILARSLGRRLNLTDIEVTSLYPEEVSHSVPQVFLQNIQKLDAVYAQKHAEAKREQKVLRYVARIDESSVKVGLEAVPEASPLGRLKGTDNTVVFYTRRYSQNPLVVTGPGAGAEVTAAGVLNDIIALAGRVS